MCQKRNSVCIKSYAFKNYKKIRVDPCMRNFIKILLAHGVHTLACCCGHGRYTKTVIFKGGSGRCYELLSGTFVPRTRNFYKKDKKGFFYLPEIDKVKP